MKVSSNWLRDFLDIDKNTTEITDILTSLGLEVEGWEEVKASAVDLDKVLSGLVLTCERIPDTDHLSATTVDVGDGVVRSIVCGAPNVGAGQKVFVALPGANVFSKDGQLFTIGERKVKGVPSQGMICAQDELGVGHDHSGIMVLPETTPLGVSAATWFKKTSDTVIEIGLTPNRADATNHLGVARDLLAWVRHHENPQAQLKSDGNEALALRSVTTTSPAPLKVQISDTEACPRYAGLVIRNLRVGESPSWLQDRLNAVGQRPINNVVDVTNYIRSAVGQPLHAFDLAKIHGGEVRVKTLPAGTVFKSLDGTDRVLSDKDLMICDGADTPMCMGGVFGGADSGVAEATTDIFLESACFNPKWIRRSMLHHSLRTDAAWTFEKGVDPNGGLRALYRAAQLICELAGGEIAPGEVDIYPVPQQAARIAVQYARVNSLIGEALAPATVRSILVALDIGMEEATETGFTAIVPTNKPDVTREADIIEEILRVHGLDNVPIPAQIRSSMELTKHPSSEMLRNAAADFLAANGYNECMSLALSNSALYTGDTALLPVEASNIVFIHNSANQGLDCLRPTMLFSGLEAVQRNQNRQNADLRLFEFGKTYSRNKAENGAVQASETGRLAIFLTGAHSPESWHPVAKPKVDFYTLKSMVQNLLSRLGVVGYQENTVEEAGFQYALRLHRGPQELASLGQVSTGISKRMDVKNAVFYADINFEAVSKAAGKNNVQYAEVSKYPSVRRDLAVVVDKAVSFAELRALANKTTKKILKDVNLFDVFEDESKLGEGKKSYALSFIFEDAEKTLQDKEIDAAFQQLQDVFEGKLGAAIRK